MTVGILLDKPTSVTLICIFIYHYFNHGRGRLRARAPSGKGCRRRVKILRDDMRAQINSDRNRAATPLERLYGMMDG